MNYSVSQKYVWNCIKYKEPVKHTLPGLNLQGLKGSTTYFSFWIPSSFCLHSSFWKEINLVKCIHNTLHLKFWHGPTWLFLYCQNVWCNQHFCNSFANNFPFVILFSGLVVNLACRGDYNVFPNQVKCRRKNPRAGDSELEWSHIPVCYPSVLVSKTHWTKTLHARSVSCAGDSQETNCYLSCIRDYIAVESEPYR